MHGVDKFPRMVDYVVPTGVRIADADRVRLGAHLAEGTTVMHEGFVNFNAGTLGRLDGRGPHLGRRRDRRRHRRRRRRLDHGHALGRQRDRDLGRERCLLGANSGLGIPLGDECTVESGLYLTAGTKVRLPDGDVVRARELSGISGMLFRRDSQSGAVEALRARAPAGTASTPRCTRTKAPLRRRLGEVAPALEHAARVLLHARRAARNSASSRSLPPGPRTRSAYSA